jgi:hypothetical protein
MATSIYTNQPGAQYGYPQPPPSPPMEDTPKCSLPSISNLLVMADAGSPTTEQPPQSQQQGPTTPHEEPVEYILGLTHEAATSSKPNTRPNSSHHASNGTSRSALPPTPPMSSDASFEGYNSPSTKSISQLSSVSAPNYYYETTPPVEDVHRTNMATAAAPRLPIQASYHQQSFATSYMSQPSMAPYYPSSLSSVPQAQPQISGLYYQRPLPQVSLHN